METITDIKQEEARYRLEVSKRAAITTSFTADEHGRVGEAVHSRNEERWERTSDYPPYYQPKVGTYEEVSAQATKLNNIQMGHGFIDHLYSAEPVEADPVSYDTEAWLAITENFK